MLVRVDGLCVVCQFDNEINGSTMKRRINISLPEETIELIDGVAKPGDRSNLIDRAIHHYVESVGRQKLRRVLAEGARRRTARDLAIASDWFALDEEAWSTSRR